MFVSPPLDASVCGQAYPPFSLLFESYVPSPVWICSLPCPRNVEVANHYLVVDTGQAEFKMRPF